MQDDDGIAAVVFSAEQRRRLDGVQTVFERLYFGGDLFFDGLAFSGELEERLQVGNRARKLFIGLDGLGQTLALAQDSLAAGAVVPEAGSGDFPLDLL